MALFKPVKKPVVRGSTAGGAEISSQRPDYVPKTAPCVATCPCGTDIRGCLTTIAQAEEYGRSHDQAYEMAWQKLTDCNPFPAVCGRVCPHHCEDDCNRRAKEGPVAISALERFIGDFAITSRLKFSKLSKERHPEKIAVVGAGPAGLSCAYQLARRGYSAVVFEAFPQPGGMLRYGIPRYRLPRETLDAEIQRILDLGVELACNQIVGKDVPLDELRQQYAAVFVGIGAHRGLKLGVPGEDSANVLTGTSFLNRVNRREEVCLGDKVIVVGGGDSAMDTARIARRLGAGVTLLCWEMPAIKSEIEGALEEGVKMQWLVAPVEILVDNGLAKGVRCTLVELSEPDASGRRRPLPRPGTEFHLEASTIIAAIGQEPNFNGFVNLSQGESWIKVNEWGATGVEGIFAGGDAAGLGLVTTAIAQGHFAAQAIEARLRGRTLERPFLPWVIKSAGLKLGWYKEAARRERSRVAAAERGIDTEIEHGLTEAEASEEAKRCLSCGMCMDCETCWKYCSNACFVKLSKGEHYKVKIELCNGCQKCAQECPSGYIEMR